MDAQSPSKRFTRGSMSKSNTMQEIKSKLKNNPIRLEGMSAKSKQSNIKIVEGGKKDQSAAGSNNEKDFVFNTEEPNRIILQYFGVEKAITKSQLVEKFDNKVWGGIMMMMRYIDYPWGKKAFDLLILHLHTKIKHDGKYFRILNWKTKKDFPRLSYFAKGMFRDDNNPLVFKNITPTPMELKILELPPEYVQSDSSPIETAAANASDDDFQDPPCPINNKGKEKVDTCLSPPKKKSRQTVTPIQNKTTPRVISKQPCLIKSPRRANVAKRPKSPLPKRQAKKHANVPSYTGIKQNVEIKSSVPFEIPSTSKSHDFSISRDEFDQFKLSMEKQFTDLRNFIENNFKVVLDSIKSKNAEDKGDGVEVTDKVPVGVIQSEEPSQHLPSELNCQSVFNDLNDQEKVVRVSVPSSTPEVSIHQSKLHSPAGQSAFSPLVQQFSNPEPQGHNNYGVPINFKVQNTSNIFEVQNNSEKENCEDVPIEVVKEGSQFMDDQTDFNNSSFDLLNVIHDQTEKMEKEEISATNKAGSSNVNELVVEEVLMSPAPLQMVHDDQPNINPERNMVLHPLLAVGEHTPLPIHRERRPGPFNTSPYVTSFGSDSGSSSMFHFSFDLKHPFVAMSDLEHTTLSIQIYDSLRGGALHDSSVENEIKKYAQLVPMYLFKSDFYGKKGIDISSHPKYKSHSECDSFEMIYVNDIPQQDAGSLDCGLYVVAYADHISNGNGVPNSFDSEFTRIQYASLLWNYGVQKIQADATSDSEAPERPIRIHRDCDSSEMITIN
ncbi:hypothetical protein KY290_010719 [Solanum tuberosum]|uniref:Ubiquitin-like protease family profile domain-containing protein n=1 Tax=Solanum tuberosum TaxID=4113 RepID=A0ABQ7W165_SOLTU|nr:hypothetical protein KY290_010719 [Solanum tuberosum]